MRFRRGLDLARKSWRIVSHDRRLLTFPAAASLIGLLLGSAIVYWGSSHGRWGYLVASLVFYFPATFVNAYLGTAFVAVARDALDGRPYALRDGFRCANRRLPALLAWSALATAVLLVLQVLQNIRGGWLVTKLAGWLLGLVWAAASFFVIPVLAIEGQGATEALRRSARLVKERWGEAATGVSVIGAAFVVTFVPAAALIGIGVAEWPSPGSKIAIAIGIAILAVSIALQATTTQLFQLVLYRYATNGTVTAGFTEEDLEHPFSPRRRGLFRRRR